MVIEDSYVDKWIISWRIKECPSSVHLHALMVNG